MKITKANAHEAAKKIAQPIIVEQNKKELQLREAVTKIMKSRIPKAVLDTYEKHKSYFKTDSSVCLDGNGFQWRRVVLTETVPDDLYKYTPTEKETPVLMKLHNEIESLKEKHEQTVRDIETSILSCSTYKRLADEFPEAIPFLPEVNTCTTIAINIQPVRNTVKQLAKKAVA